MRPFRGGGGTHLLPSGHRNTCDLASLSAVFIWSFFYSIGVVKKKDTSGRRLHNVNWIITFFFLRLSFSHLAKMQHIKNEERREPEARQQTYSNQVRIHHHRHLCVNKRCVRLSHVSRLIFIWITSSYLHLVAQWSSLWWHLISLPR